MKKVSIASLTLLLCISLFMSAVSASPAIPQNNTEARPAQYERVISILEKNNIDFQIIDGKLMLKQTTHEAVTKANILLRSAPKVTSFTESSISVFASYPTPWVHNKTHDIVRSKKFTGATKTAFSAAFAVWAKDITTSWQELLAVAVGGFGGYYFINTDEEDLYTFIKYYYRELGPGRFDMIGNFLGDYEIKKEMRVTKNSNGTGGSFDTDIRKSTTVDPWF
ncbi:hypothetical protein NDS46_31720 (plasmid) [Paenibacillus thiaminolyticus]|uniref:hypothetical protein n=1 Tax=Paenibacillus thiaminolyticus TaxID=49283 RepID=UPI002330C969|nr:hypothetical protein [Paenibacillus thiaminolyticus]WCF11528.1 hypothetical protein NDS46_31720 [Paenibacillus thiaminolyticus]